jgi:hypothetical protein
VSLREREEIQELLRPDSVMGRAHHAEKKATPLGSPATADKVAETAG